MLPGVHAKFEKAALLPEVCSGAGYKRDRRRMRDFRWLFDGRKYVFVVATYLSILS